MPQHKRIEISKAQKEQILKDLLHIIELSHWEGDYDPSDDYIYDEFCRKVADVASRASAIIREGLDEE